MTRCWKPAFDTTPRPTSRSRAWRLPAIGLRPTDLAGGTCGRTGCTRTHMRACVYPHTSVRSGRTRRNASTLAFTRVDAFDGGATTTRTWVRGVAIPRVTAPPWRRAHLHRTRFHGLPTDGEPETNVLEQPDGPTPYALRAVIRVISNGAICLAGEAGSRSACHRKCAACRFIQTSGEVRN